MLMQIASAVQRGSSVYVYDQNGSQLCSLSAGSGPNDGLKGYTGCSVSIRRGSTIYTYNEKGSQISVTSAV